MIKEAIINVSSTIAGANLSSRLRDCDHHNKPASPTISTHHNIAMTCNSY